MDNPRDLKGVAAADYVAKNKYTDWGGFELYAVMGDGESLCFRCCDMEREFIEAAELPGDEQWYVEGVGSTEMLEETELCAHCGRVIFEPDPCCHR